MWRCIILLIKMNQHEEFKVETGENQVELILSYLFASNFFQYLRNTYPHFLRISEEEKRNLVVSSEIFRVKQDKTTLLINYNQPTISILIYGELKTNGKHYSKGCYFSSQIGQQQMQFTKKTAILMLNKVHIEDCMRQSQEFYMKIDILEHILPVELLGLQKRGYKFLNSYAEIVKGVNKKLENLNSSSRLGVFILFQGTFVVVSKNGLKLTQISSDYFGEETLWTDDFEYNLRPQSYEFKYIFIPRQAFLQILSSEMMVHLKDFFKKKQKLRAEIQQNYTKNLLFTQNFLKNSPVKKVKKRFTPEQVEEFTQVLGKMAKQNHRPKWKRQEDELQRQRLKKLKQKRVYIPSKPKSKYFSTLTDNTFDFGYHEILHHQENQQPYQPKLHLHQRAKTEIIFKRKGNSQSKEKAPQTQRTQPSPDEKISQLVRKNSHRYYSHNYDRSYSVGMSNLVKMRKYDELKKSSTLQRGEKVLTTEQLTKALSASFQKLHTSMSATVRDKKMDPEVLMSRTMKQNKLLIDKFMQSKGGFATWR